jgi:hypothetical protein
MPSHGITWHHMTSHLGAQGAELLVLRTLDWSQLTVNLLIVECKGLGCTDKQDKAVRTYLETEAGMRWRGVLRARHDVWDALFVRAAWDGGASFAPQAQPSPRLT